MPSSSFAQADLFDDADEHHGPSLRQAWAHQDAPRRRRFTRAFDLEGAAQILNGHDDYRVLWRLKPRPVDFGYAFAPAVFGLLRQFGSDNEISALAAATYIIGVGVYLLGSGAHRLRA